MFAHTTGNTGVGLALALTVLVTGAVVPTIKKTTDYNRVRTVAGEAVKLGNGTVHAYLTMDGDQPMELGVAISKATMASLPEGHGVDNHVPGRSFFPNLLPLPKENPTPFRMVELDWNPMGHEPDGVYTKPHFDFHFYTIDRAEWDQITPENPEFQRKGLQVPSAEYVPAGYIMPAPMVVPKMGLHWVNPMSPELSQGKPFGATFIYGSWDGKFIFAEPMITKQFIEETTDFTADVPMAVKYAVAGYHPSKYRVRFDEASQEYRIAITGFIKK
jgi:hypothetical protein